MHNFDDLADQCAVFTLEALRNANERTVEALQTSAATSLVKALQMIQLQKVILAVGMFSIFEASLQDRLNCKDGFREVEAILDQHRESNLKERFLDLAAAINVLKHGRGRSYKLLVDKAQRLPFRVKLPSEKFFFEGDVSEISTLIEVDDAFVQRCGDVISNVSEVLRKVRPDFV
ncbi:hypothetical protein PSCICE_16110 [Pseudomonas cichorii]|nr:hypothetical protein [Pseudomonas cichorii]GFM50344.1 hypothetical protein PSCICE_16110 [Pseudomonas cichorii]GFM62072.1 hypothetical protein PSCICG_32320 [Pseudomonas cichorii]